MLEFKNKQAESMIVNAVDYARAKHPYFASDLSQALLLAQEELGEAIKAFNGHVEAQHEMRDYSYKDVLEELSHCAAYSACDYTHRRQGTTSVSHPFLVAVLQQNVQNLNLMYG